MARQGAGLGFGFRAFLFVSSVSRSMRFWGNQQAFADDFGVVNGRKKDCQMGRVKLLDSSALKLGALCWSTALSSS